MSLKSLSKTRWKIEPDRVTVYPYGVFHIFTIILAIIFAGLLFVYFRYENSGFGSSLPIVLLFALMLIFFWGSAYTYIEFDSRVGRMRKMLMGFLPVKNIPFAKLQGINPVSNVAGSYNYRLFRKDARYGKGIVVSSGYTKNDDPNAIAFVEEAVPVIHGFLDLHDTLNPPELVESITSYKYFNQQGNIYTLKNKKAGAIVFGLIFIGLGFYILFATIQSIIGALIITAIMFILGLAFINAAFTKISFDTENKTIQRTGLFKFFNRTYSFGNFAGIQTLRRTYNFIYVGTDVNMYFDAPDKAGKQNMLTVISLKKSADIERFLQEIYKIMGM
ncbi:hypothetical protein [Mucilaginibacter terrae]|nr:hypothetical protein [Mucilaginibacter terrae]